MICPKITRTYKFVRVGNRIVISSSETEYHVDLLRDFEGLGNLNRGGMEEKIRENEDLDMGRMRRGEDNRIVVYGESITFQFPDGKTKEKVRPRTMEILRRQYPEEEFFQMD